MYLNKLNVQKTVTNFKKRYITTTRFVESQFVWLKSTNKFNKYSYIFSKNQVHIELKVYKLFFLNLRRLSRKKNFFSFVLLFCNHTFSKKARNARMGKGKGKMARFVCKKKNLQPLFIFKFLSVLRIKKFVCLLKKKSNQNFFFFFVKI